MFRTTVASLRRYFYKSAPVRGVYELSIDTMKPSKVAAYVDSIGPLLSSSLSSKSRLLGSFTTYLGSQTGEFVYLREHDSGNQLAASRDELLEKVKELGDVWQCCKNQETTVLYPFPWYKTRDPPTGGLFEYRSYVLKPGFLNQFGHRFEQAIDARTQYSQCIGIWYSEIGMLHAVHHIWHYDSLDHRTDVRSQALCDEVWREAVRDLAAFIVSGRSRILQPTGHSK